MKAERKFWKEFIRLYRDSRCLWDVNSADHKSKEAKDISYQVLVDKIKTIDPTANLRTVRKKINILRTNFRRELHRVSCSCTNVKSKLWYFEDMMFTVGNEKTKNGTPLASTSRMETENEVDACNEDENELVIDLEVSKEELKAENERIKNLKREYWTEFIKLYESFPSLWKTNIPEYKDRKLKEECYAILANKLKEIEPDANRASVRRRINTLRCNFRREQYRVQRTQSSPKLWYYNTMSFLFNQEISASDKDENLHDDSADDLDIKPDVEHSMYQYPIRENCETITSHLEDIECKSEIESISEHSMGTNIGLQEVDSTLFNTVSNAAEDEFDLQGKIWAAEYRKLTPEQQLFAKKAIDDIFFERRLAGMVQSQNK